MGTISKAAEECQKCPDMDKCDFKHMGFCAQIKAPRIPKFKKGGVFKGGVQIAR